MNNTDVTFKALTIIDPATNLIEIIQIRDKKSRTVTQAFANCWLARYPWPMRVIHDNGGEFIGWEFQELMAQLGITSVATTVKNPQANGIIERSHKTITDMLRVMLHITPPQNNQDADELIDNCFASCVHTMRCAHNHTMQTSPGATVFNRDMTINIPLMADYAGICQQKQQLIDSNLL